MSDRRVPRFEDDYSAELPTWPPRGVSTAGCRLPTAGDPVSSQGAYPARPAASSIRPQSDGAAFSSDAAAFPSPARREEAGVLSPQAPASALSEPVRMLVMMIGAYHRESDTAAIERAVAHYAEVLGIHALARPMEDRARAHEARVRANVIAKATYVWAMQKMRDSREGATPPAPSRASPEPPSRVPAARGSVPAFSPDDRATGAIDGSGSKPPQAGVEDGSHAPP